MYVYKIKRSFSYLYPLFPHYRIKTITRFSHYDHQHNRLSFGLFAITINWLFFSKKNSTLCVDTSHVAHVSLQFVQNSSNIIFFLTHLLYYVFIFIFNFKLLKKRRFPFSRLTNLQQSGKRQIFNAFTLIQL